VSIEKAFSQDYKKFGIEIK